MQSMCQDRFHRGFNTVLAKVASNEAIRAEHLTTDNPIYELGRRYFAQLASNKANPTANTQYQGVFGYTLPQHQPPCDPEIDAINRLDTNDDETMDDVLACLSTTEPPVASLVTNKPVKPRQSVAGTIGKYRNPVGLGLMGGVASIPLLASLME